MIIQRFLTGRNPASGRRKILPGREKKLYIKTHTKKKKLFLHQLDKICGNKVYFIY